MGIIIPLSMDIQNQDIAKIFDQMADFLEIENGGFFRIRAYREAARILENLPQSVAQMVAENQDLDAEISGIGKDLAKKIVEIVTTGKAEKLEEMKQRNPPGITDLLLVPGVGPARVRTLRDKLGVTNLEQLKEAVSEHKIRELEGFGEKSEQQIAQGLTQFTGQERRLSLPEAEIIATGLADYLKHHPGVETLDIAGSFRRRKETVGDLDILIISLQAPEVMDYFVAYPEVARVISKGPTRSTVILKSGLQVDLRVVPAESYGAALLYFTGNKAHNIALRDLTMSKGWKLNEYGVFDGEKQLAGANETDIYTLFHLPFITPELRENRGEIPAAQIGKLPNLVTLNDLKGDLQSHTTFSDGRDTLEAMAQAAQAKGYEYWAVTDHSQRLTVAHGLDAKRLQAQLDLIDQLNATFTGFRILKSCEVDVLEDGTLDLSEDILARLDYRLCSIHSLFNLSREQQTERILRAMDNPYFNILAHPTGRLVGKREPYDIDLEKILHGARERGCFVELDGQSKRLDLNDVHARMAKDMNVKVSISSDAHSILALDDIRFGVDQARRGWLEKEDVLNTRSWVELQGLLKRR
jgi:DNA polymerase (family 10)